MSESELWHDMEDDDGGFDAAYQQQLIDTALLLTLWHRASTEEAGAGGRLRMMKLAYLFLRALAERRVSALGVRFYRWRYGPMSNQVYDAWERLCRCGLMEEEEVWSVTDAGAQVAAGFYAEVLSEEVNVDVKRALDHTVQKWRSAWSAQPMMEHIYELCARIDDSGPTIRDMREGEEFDDPLSRLEADAAITVNNAWIETLALEFNPHSRAMLRAAVEDFRAGRFTVA